MDPLRRSGDQNLRRCVNTFGPMPATDPEYFCKEAAIEPRIGRAPCSGVIIRRRDRRDAGVAAGQWRLDGNGAASEFIPGGDAIGGEMVCAPNVVTPYHARSNMQNGVRYLACRRRSATLVCDHLQLIANHCEAKDCLEEIRPELAVDPRRA